jgi:tetratricopeptide (TPR) repeat protein
VRMLLDEGRIERSGDGFRPVGDAQPLSIPATLQGLIAARLDGLDPADRSLLQAASVMGKTFSLDAAADVSGEDRETLAPRLRSLVRRELLTLEADPRSPERGQYGFVQGLIREVAYGGLGRRDRRRLHLAAARHFETLGDDGIAGVLAEHYVAAYHAQPDGPEGDAVAAQARVALRAAAERAASLGSYSQAATYFEQALEVTSNPDEQAQLHKAAGDASLQGGRAPDDILAHYRAALELVSHGEDRARQLEATTDLGRGTGWVGHSEPAVRLMEQALVDFADLDGTAEWVRLNTELSRVYMLVGRPAEALTCIEGVLPLAERLELRREVLELLVTRGATVASQRRLGEAIVLLLGAVSQGRSLQLPGLELRAAVNLSYATAAEDAQLSHRVAREGLERARHLGLRSQAAYLLNNASDTAVRIGEWDWFAEQINDDSIADESAPFGQLIHRARIRAFRGLDSESLVAEAAAFLEGHTELQAFSMLDEIRCDVAMAEGRFEDARTFAISSYERVDAPDSSARARAGRLSIWLRDPDAVARILDEQRGVPGAMARISDLELQAGLAALGGRSREAINLFREALAQWRERGIRFELALAALSMVYALGGDGAEVREAAAEAREIFTQLGAAPFLALLDAAEAERPSAVAATRSAADSRVSSTR